MGIEIKENKAILKINPKIYSLDVIYSAAYVFLDRVYIVLDGDPEKEIIVELKAKKNGNIEKIGNEFFNELINYSDYSIRAKESKEIREMILKRALITNEYVPEEDINDEEFENLLKELETEDSEEVTIPFEKNDD